MNYLKNISIYFLFALNSAQALELVNGTNQEFGMNFTPAQRTALPIVTKTIKENDSSGIGLSLAFTNIVGTSNWFRLYDNMHIYGVDISEGKLLGNWPLTPWAYNHQPPEIIDRAKKYGTTASSFVTGTRYPVGCYGDTPLNYGDLDNDKTNELIIFMGNTLVVFSPHDGRTIFSSWLSLDDWFHPEDSRFYFEGEYGENLKTPEDPQYESRLIHRRGKQEDHAPGYRGYSKIYVGDFDKDNNIDILVWRKIYLSNLEKDAQRGFTLVRNEWNHFERNLTEQKATDTGVTGEYLPQDTAPETIQNWLTSANLTWSKGFPSLSECAGEEGKLIPEMHDPLLNDPDVLQ